MTVKSVFNFVQKDTCSITVERSFNAPLDQVWAAWTDPEILCQWWAPKPYRCVIKSLDFREGGRWLYYMEGPQEGPQGDRLYAFFDYETIRPRSLFSGTVGFCNEQGTLNTSFPQTKWENTFSESDGCTLVRIHKQYLSVEDLERNIAMGFKEGFTTGLDQLEELLKTH